MQLSIKKANKLVEVGENLSKSAKLFVLYLIAMTPEDDTEFRKLTVNYDELKRIINIDGKKRLNNISDAIGIMDEIGKNPLRFENTDVQDDVYWFAIKRYYKNEKKWEIQFHEHLKPYLLNLKEFFTKYNFWYTVNLTSHSIKFYELMKRYEYKKGVSMSVEQQKYYLGMEDKYSEYYEYRRWVLDPVKRELEKYTDVKFTYLPLKEGRRVVGHHFTIMPNTPKKLPGPIKGFQKHLERESTGKKELKSIDQFQIEHSGPYLDMKRWGGTEASIKAILKTHGIDKILYQQRYAKRIFKNKSQDIRNKFGWFKRALEEGYTDPVAKTEDKIKEIKVKQKQKIEKEDKQKMQKREHAQLLYAKCDEILAENKGLLELIIEELRGEHNFVIGSVLRKNWSPQKIYSNNMYKPFIRKKIEEKYPERFH